MDRARALFEYAIAQPQLDMPEFLWKTYIDFEIDQEEFGRVRNLFRKLLERTKHVKVTFLIGHVTWKFSGKF
jgi:crooked neck